MVMPLLLLPGVAVAVVLLMLLLLLLLVLLVLLLVLGLKEERRFWADDFRRIAGRRIDWESGAKGAMRPRFALMIRDADLMA
jgi:hypothetical protein